MLKLMQAMCECVRMHANVHVQSLMKRNSIVSRL